ncbi:MAG: AAA family ATPase [Gammaproteobacteria bacterium]|nr:AAA family ATPase [Gammaproteobacteria bacterium]
MPKNAKSISEYNKLLQTLDKKINKKDLTIETVLPNQEASSPNSSSSSSSYNVYTRSSEDTNIDKFYLDEVMKKLENEFKQCMLLNTSVYGLMELKNTPYVQEEGKSRVRLPARSLTPPLPKIEPIPYPISIPEPKLVNIEPTIINNVDDLLALIDKYPYDTTISYNINMKTLYCIKEPLIKLKNMIGMKTLKETLVEQILYFIQGFNKGDFMHAAIYGPPGTGKTEIAKIMGEIYSKMGVLSKGAFKKVTRSDLIAGYLGQTALKTTRVIEECLGGVLFIDEAYALGSTDKKDSFSKECIDTLCEALSNHKENLMVIVAGYETELNECFFSNNQGLNSRFTWRFKTDDYTTKDLCEIFMKMIKDVDWKIDEKIITPAWFEKKMEYFKYFGRDMETLLSKVKIAHSKRVFSLAESEGCMKKVITAKDLDNGFELYLKNDEVKNRKESERQKQFMHTIYV